MNTGRIVLGMLLGGLISSSAPALAADGGQSGANVSAYQHAGAEALFTRIGDWFATLGTSGFEKDSILVQRRSARIARRTQRAMREVGEGLQKGLESMTVQ